MFNQSFTPKIELSGKYLYGHVNGEQYDIKNTPEQIAAFIMKYKMYDVTITTYFDEFLIKSSMGFIMHCADQEYLQQKLLPVLVPMQQNEVEIPEFVPYNPEDEIVIEDRLSRVELDGAIFDITVTKEPYVIHLLDLEGKPTKDVISQALYETILNQLNRIEERSDIEAVLCYGLDGEIWEYYPEEDDDDPDRLNYTDPSQYEVFPEYRTIMEKREKKQ